MRIIVLLLLFIHFLYGAKILSYDLKIHQDDITLMLTFDMPYDDSIRKSYQEGYLIIRLNDLQMDNTFIKDNLSPLIKSLTVQSQNNETMIIAKTSPETKLKVSKSKDELAMRLKLFKPPVSTSESSSPIQSVNKPVSRFNWLDYSIMLLLALAGAFGIYHLTRKKSSKPIFLFEEIKLPAEQEISNITLSIRFEKEIDANNRALLLDYNGKEYPILLGEENLFLSSETLIKSKEDFEVLIENHFNMVREREENAFIRQEISHSCEPLDSYKEKASANKSLFDE